MRDRAAPFSLRFRTCTLVGGLLLAAGSAGPPVEGWIEETEPNDSSSTAQPLPTTKAVIDGSVFPDGDQDWFSFQGPSSHKIYAATMTAGSPTFGDTFLQVGPSSGGPVLESDENDGFFSELSASIAGPRIPASGSYVIQVKGGAAPSTRAGGTRPYRLFFRTEGPPNAPAAETEPNDTSAAADVLPPSGWAAGYIQIPDQDWFRVDLGPCDTVFASLDLYPNRSGGGPWNGRLGFGFFGDGGDQILYSNDTNPITPGVPPSEAVFATVKDGGTYYFVVDPMGPGGPYSGLYELMVTVYPWAPVTSSCTTYSSTDVPSTIPAGGGLISSTITVPGHPRIADLDVSILLEHAQMADLDVHLRSPAGNVVGLFTDVGSQSPGGQAQMDLIVDDEAALPIGLFAAMKGLHYMPEPAYRLSWFDGEDAGGDWTLEIRDDEDNPYGGTLLEWSLTICEPEPAPECSAIPVTAISEDFETGEGGFTHSGTADEWARGLPSGGSSPILGCTSGTSCFKTDLTGTYEAASSQTLSSPTIRVPDVTGPIPLSWSQAYQMEDASRDHLYLEVREAGGANARKLFEWTGATMTDSVGTPVTLIQESAGWARMSADLGAYAGRDVVLRFHLDSDASGNLSGFAIDDVTITACCEPAACDDGNPCTYDRCSDPEGCVHDAISGTCDDGDPCTTEDACTNGLCAGVQTVCDDGSVCTTESCHPVTGQCWYIPMNCNDGNPCTDDGCHPFTGCTHAADDTNSCNDGNACNGGEACQDGTCIVGPVDCDDGVLCTKDACDPFMGCIHRPNCDDANPCTQDTCGPTGCTHAPSNQGAQCYSGSCTRCQNGVCTPDGFGCLGLPQGFCRVCHPGGSCIPQPCDDGNPCTDDISSPCCFHGPNDDRTWSDGNACTVEWCQSGPRSAPIVCDDGNPCTDDACNTATGCFAVPDNGNSCSDGNACTGDFCSAGTCRSAVGREVRDVRIGADKETLSWSPNAEPEALVVSYDVARGREDELPVGAGPSETCLASAIAASSLGDPSVPEAVVGFWYLVRERTDCGPGTWGFEGRNGQPSAERFTDVCP